MHMMHLVSFAKSGTRGTASTTLTRQLQALNSQRGSVVAVTSQCLKSTLILQRHINHSGKSKYVRHPWLNGQLPYVQTLSDELRVLTFLAGNAAAGNLSAVERDWCYVPEHLQPAAFEVLMQTSVFAGVPKMLNAMGAITDMMGGLYKTIKSAPEPAPEESIADVTKSAESILQSHYGSRYKRLRDRFWALHPAIDQWHTEFVFGRIRSRPGISQRERQLCVLSAMAGQIVSQQFRSTIISALNDGATLEEVRGVLDHTSLIWGDTSQSIIDALWADLNKRRVESHHSVFDSAAQTVAAEKKASTKLLRIPVGRHPFIKYFRVAPSVSDTLRILCLLAANTNVGNLTGVARDWSYLPEESHAAGLEVLLQTAVFAGFQRSINALQTVHDVGVSPTAITIEKEVVRTKEERIQKGEALLKAIYKNQYTRLRERLRTYHPDVEKFVLEYAYGTVLSREGSLTPRERELCALACLSGQMVLPQFHSHLLGALNVGATMDDIRAILDQTEIVWGRNEQSIVDGFWLDFMYQLNRKEKVKGTCL